MTLSDLNAWRKRAPWFIFIVCLLPWFWIKSKSPDKTIVSVAALILTYFYVGADFRSSMWEKELDAHVKQQVRQVLLDMVPQDLAVTESEKRELLQRQIFGKLTGVFWEAIDQSQELRAHKEHFYSNGIVYSTSIDVFLICGSAGLVYAVASLVTRKPDLAYVSAFSIAIALASRGFITPRRRERHLALSAEQLELIRRKESVFVSNRFREIILSWRRERLLHQG
ncbi:MAG: hypothetical protein ACRD4C_01510 [Candidatus Acidiferrales bacterium]